MDLSEGSRLDAVEVTANGGTGEHITGSTNGIYVDKLRGTDLTGKNRWRQPGRFPG